MGEFPTVSAAATAVAAAMVARRSAAHRHGGRGRGVLVLGFAGAVTALEVMPE
jgi:hypothetical protein